VTRSKLTVLFLGTVAIALYALSGLAGVSNVTNQDSSLDGPITGIRTYMGGYGHSIIPIQTGGIMMAGTYGAGGGNCCQPWLTKLDNLGTPIWQLLYEAEGLAGANNMQQTSDGGYIFAGEGVNLLAVKVDADGNVEWSKNYGEGGHTLARVFITPDDDYLILGTTKLEDDGFHSNGRLVKVDQQGNVLWQKVMGQFGVSEYFTSATVAHNGNYLIVGMNAGNYWVVEFDQSGDVVWQKTYGGPYEDDAWTVTRFRDHLYIVVGSSDSFAQGGLRNWWAILISETGDLILEQAFGGLDSEDPNIVIETSDGGAMIGGGTGSFGAGGSDIWLIKFDSRGRIQWQKTYGLNRTEHAWHIQELPSGGYMVVGDSYLYPATYDIWLMVIDENGDVRFGDCGEIGDTFVSPIPTSATVQVSSTPVIDTDIEAVDFRVDIVEQILPIEDCPPGIPSE
jgi:hypothetical protein